MVLPLFDLLVGSGRGGVRVVALLRLLGVRVYLHVVLGLLGRCRLRLVVVVHLVLVQSRSDWVVGCVPAQLRHVVGVALRRPSYLDAARVRLRPAHDSKRCLIVEFAARLRVLLQHLLLFLVAWHLRVQLHVA